MEGPALSPSLPPARLDRRDPARLDLGDALEKDVIDRFGAGRENFVVPSTAEMAAFGALVGHARAGTPLERLQAEAAPLGIDVASLPVGSRHCVKLADADRGWGTVIVDPAARSPLIVECPHPAYDLGTPELGWLAFQQFDAAALVVAGAARGNRQAPSPDVDGEAYEHNAPWTISDPAHARATMFEAAHEALSQSGSVVLQLHGFNAKKHHEQTPAFPADQQLVLSDGLDDEHDPPLLTAAQAALVGAGYRSRIVTFEDEATSQLSAVANVQRRDMSTRGLLGPEGQAEFVHIEIDGSIRRAPDRDTQYQRLLDTLRPVFTESSSPR